MDEQTRRARDLDALEIIAAELAKLRIYDFHQAQASITRLQGAISVLFT